MVYEARPGQVFLLGASSWRIEEITRDRVVVTPAPGVPGAVPFWKGDGVGRPKELGEAIGAFARWAVEQDAGGAAERDYDLDPLAAQNLIAFLREQQEATRVVPSDRTIVVERFRDEIGDWRLCVLSPFGGRVHAAWGLALSRPDPRAVRPGVRRDLVRRRDHRPPARRGRAARARSSCCVEPDELEDLVVGELGGSALFGARFRENAGRALLIPRAYPGRRTPLWQQRLKSQTLLEVAKRYGQFPIVLETYRECLRDVLDVPGLQDLLRKLHSRELSVVEVETPTASPFASSLLFDYVATYMYESDKPNAERRAAALALDRELLRELLGQEELRDLIDPGALEQVEADLQRRSERTRADSRRRAARRPAPRRRPHRGGAGAADRARRRPRRLAAASSRRERRAIVLRVGGEQRWIAAEDAGLYRDALGAVPPGGLPAPFLEDVPDAMERLVRRFARTHGPFEGAGCSRSATGSTSRRCSRASSAPASWCAASCARAAREREWCDPEVLRRLRRASLAALRAEIEPADQRALARFLPSWQGVDRHPPAGAGIDRLREALVPLQGLALPAEVWERDVLPRRVGAYIAVLARPAVRLGRGRVGRRRRARPAQRQGRALLPRGRGRARPAAGGARRSSVRRARPHRDPHPARPGRVLLHRPARRRRRHPQRGAAGGAVGPRVGRRGDQRRVRAAALAARGDGRLRPAGAGRARAAAALRHAPQRRPSRRSRGAGR